MIDDGTEDESDKEARNRRFSSLKKFLQFNYWFNPLLSRNFCQKSARVHNTAWKIWKFTVTHLWQKIRESNGFTKEVTKGLIWRFFFSVTVNFSFFHSALWHNSQCGNFENFPHLKDFRQIDIQYKSKWKS